MKKLLWASLLVFTLLVFTPVPVFASEPLDGQVVFGGTFTLEEDDVLDGDLVVFGGNVTLERGSRVEGDVAVLGGNADVAGTVEGDIVIFGGSVDLTSTAVVDGDLATFGGTIERDEEATVRGNQVEGLSFDQDFRFPTFAKVWTNGYRYDWDNWLLRFFIRAFKALATVVLITVIGALVAVFLPQPLERVSQAVLAAPAHSWLVGFATAILVILVGGGMIATCCLAPIGGPIVLAGLIAGLFGWVALGLIVGLKMLEQLKASNVTPVMAVMVGSALLSLIAAVADIVGGGCLGWPLIILVGSFGLGAVVLTRLGTQAYLPAPSTTTDVVPQPPVSVAADKGELAPAEPEEEESTES